MGTEWSPKRYARQAGVEAIKTLIAIMRDSEQETPDVIRACNAILDRGYGKPSENVKVSGSVGHYVIAAPAPAENEIEWRRQHFLKPPEPKADDSGK